MDVSHAKGGLSQGLVPIDVTLPEIQVSEHVVPPGIIEKVRTPVTASTAPNPRIGVAPIGGSQCTVEIPDGTENEFAISGFVEIATQTEGVHIESKDVEEVMVDGGIDVDHTGITAFAVRQGGLGQGSAHVLEEGPGVGLLSVPFRSFDIDFLRIDILDGLAGGSETGIARIGTIDFEDVSTCDTRLTIVFREDAGHVHPILVAADFFHQGIHSVIISGRDGAAINIEEHFHKARAGGIASDLVTQFENERIVHQGKIEIVGPPEHPV